LLKDFNLICLTSLTRFLMLLVALQVLGLGM